MWTYDDSQFEFIAWKLQTLADAVYFKLYCMHSEING